MARYNRLFIYKKNSDAAQMQHVSSSFTYEYDIQAHVSNTFTFLYNILTVDARSLWESKETGHALWTVPDPENPTRRDVVIEEADDVITGALLSEDGEYLLSEDGEYLLFD